MRLGLGIGLNRLRKAGGGGGGGGDTIPVITGVPTISGTATVGNTLTASPASVSGTPTPTRTWQWARNGVDIGGATSITYTLVAADYGVTITVRQIETNTAGSDDATSAGTAIAWEPAALFQASEAGFWGAPVIGKLWQDTARTMPVTAPGDPVASWELTTAGGVIYAEQATLARRPTYRENVNGAGYLETDATADHFSIPVVPTGTWDMVMSYTSDARNWIAFCSAVAGSANASGTYWCGVGQSGSASTALADANQVQNALYFDNALSASTTRGQQYTASLTATRLHINTTVNGANVLPARTGFYQSGLTLPGPLYGLLYRSGTMDSTQRANLDAWMAALQNP